MGPEGQSDRLLLGRMSRVAGPGRWPENIKPVGGEQIIGWRLRLSRGWGVVRAALRYSQGPPLPGTG